MNLTANWSGVLKLQKPFGADNKTCDYDILYYDKDREHEGILNLGEFYPSARMRRKLDKQIFHGEYRTFWMVHIKDGFWNLSEEVEGWDDED